MGFLRFKRTFSFTRVLLATVAVAPGAFAINGAEPPRLEIKHSPRSNWIDISVRGQAGQPYLVQWTTNLTEWTEFQTLFSSETATQYFHQEIRTFYRAVELRKPVNDDFETAIELTNAIETVNGTLAGASMESGEPVHVPNSALVSVWYAWTPPASGRYTLSGNLQQFEIIILPPPPPPPPPPGPLRATAHKIVKPQVFSEATGIEEQGPLFTPFPRPVSWYDPRPKRLTAANLSIYTGSALTNLVPVAQNALEFVFDATVGVTYYIAISGFQGTYANFDVNILPTPGPANDRLEDAPQLLGALAMGTSTTVGARADPGEPWRMIWWRWIAPAETTAYVSTSGDIDSKIGLYMGNTIPELAEVPLEPLEEKMPWENEPAQNRDAAVKFEAKAGVVYTIAVYRWRGSAPVTLTIRQPPRLSRQPIHQVANSGDPVSLRVEAIGADLQFAWELNGERLPGELSPQLSIPFLTLDRAGKYQAVAKNPAGVARSEPAIVQMRINGKEHWTVADDFIPPEFKRVRTSSRDSLVYRVARHSPYLYLIGAEVNVENVGDQRIGALMRLHEADGSLDGSFRVGPDLHTISAIAVQPDGKILVAGSLGRESIRRLLRYHPDGSLDANFVMPIFSDRTAIRFRTIELLDEGKIIVAGTFEWVNGQPYSNIVRLKPDGSLDANFHPPDFIALDISSIAAVLPLPDGKFVVGGYTGFYKWNSDPPIVRLNADGTIDGSFRPEGFTSTSVRAFGRQSDGKIIAGGSLNAGLPATTLIRLHENGARDESFRVVNEWWGLTDLKVFPDDRILGVGAIIRLSNSDGTAATSFTAATLSARQYAQAYSLQVAEGGSFYVSGNFTAVGDAPRNGLARFTASGQLDPSFVAPSLASEIYDLLHWPVENGSIRVFGDFQKVNGSAAPGMAQFGLDGRLNSKKQLAMEEFDTVWAVAPTRGGGLYYLAQDYDSTFFSYERTLGLLRADGTQDPLFQEARVSPSVESLFVQRDGKVLLTQFDEARSPTPFALSRCNLDGSADTNFFGLGEQDFGLLRRDPDQITGYSYTIGRLRILYQFASGQFLASVPTPEGDLKLIRLHENGMLDTNFVGGVFDGGTPFRVQPPTIFGVGRMYVRYEGPIIASELADGSLLLAGQFATYNGEPAPSVLKIDRETQRVANFQVGIGPQLDGPQRRVATIDDLLVQPDGKILVAGRFDTFDGEPYAGLARLNPDGSLDKSFQAAVRWKEVRISAPTRNRLSIAPNGTIYVTGQFALGNESWPSALLKLVPAH
jgi:uncharacterized delta-60 repeat protein